MKGNGRHLGEEEHHTITGTYRAVSSVEKQTKWQWGVIVSVAVALGGFGKWGIGRYDLANEAQAQTAAETRSNTNNIAALQVRVEGVDAGTRLAIENIRKEISDNNAIQNKKLDDVKAMMEIVLREVRKK